VNQLRLHSAGRCLPGIAALALLLGPTLAQAYESTPIGDGSAYQIVLSNDSVHALNASVGAADAPSMPVLAEGFATTQIQVQCAGRHPSDLPNIVLQQGSRVSPVPTQPITFPDGPPLLWISSARTGRSALEAVITSVRSGVRVVHQSPASVPAAFDALRFADGILIDGADLASLSAQQRRALRGAVAAGVTLVVGLGAADVSSEVLAELAPVALGGTGPVGPALAAALTRASGLRSIRPKGAAHPTLTADGQPVVVEYGLGLGRVRLVGVPFAELEPGLVASAVFEAAPDALGQVLAWLDRAAPLADGAGVAWSPWVWGVLLMVPLLGLIFRRWPRLATALAVPVWIGAFVVPPVDQGLHVESLRVLHVPLDGQQDLVIGNVDLFLGQGGGRTLPASLDAAIEDVRPGGGCLVRTPLNAAWVLAAEPGERRRLSWFALREATPVAATAESTLPDWPAGPLAGVGLERLPLAAIEGPVAQAADVAEGWRVVSTAHTPKPPRALPDPSKP
jgi:hypothetical protein